MPFSNTNRFLRAVSAAVLFPAAALFGSNESSPFQLDLRLSLAEWAQASGIPAAVSAPDVIAGPLGLPNLAAYGLGLHPLEGDRRDLPSLAPDPLDESLLVFTYTVNRDTTGVTLMAEHSPDMIEWAEIQPVSDVLVDELGDGVEKRAARVERTPGQPVGFFRIRVKETP